MTNEYEPPLIDVPLTVDVVDNEIVVDGALLMTVSLTKDAALETGIELINAALGIDPEVENKDRGV